MSNTTRLTGNIGNDGTLRYTKSGKAVFSFSVADNIGYGDNERTQWVECSIWGKRAENEKLTSLLIKGARVTVEGEIEFDPPTEKWKGGLKMPFANPVHISPPIGQSNQTQTPHGGAQSGQDFDTDSFSDSIPF